MQLYLSTALLLIFIVVGIGNAFVHFFWPNVFERVHFFVVIFICLGILACVSIWTVYRFVCTLLLIAKQRATSTNSADAKINEQQQTLINLSSKYVSLFIVAIWSTTGSAVISAVFRLYFDYHPGGIWAIDGIINIVCLYLYHSFAAHHYERYCGRLDSCCKAKMSSSIMLENKLAIAKRTSTASESYAAEIVAGNNKT